MLRYTLDAARGLQVPLLATLLIAGALSKAWRDRPHGPAALVPGRLRTPVLIATPAAEFLLGVALLATQGSTLAGLPAAMARACTALFFLIAAGTLYLVRQRRPDVGCGCFGDLSQAPIGLRTIWRACLLGGAGLVSIGAPALRMPSSSRQAWLWLALIAIELAGLVALSPEVGEIMVRLGYSDPCELRKISESRTLAALRSSSAWRRHAAMLPPGPPADIWREGCWRFVVYPGVTAGRRVDVVFAVYLQHQRPPVRVGMLDVMTDQVLRESAGV